MAQVAAVSISAVHAQTTALVPSIGVSSVPIYPCTAASALSGCMVFYRCIALRFVCSPADCYHLTRTMHSAGRTGSSIGLPFIHSVTFATLGTTVIHAPQGLRSTTSPSSTSTAGTNCGSGFATARQKHRGVNVGDNCSECAGTRHPSIVLKLPFLLISLTLTTNLPSKENSTCTTSIMPSCKNQTIRDGSSQW